MSELSTPLVLEVTTRVHQPFDSGPGLVRQFDVDVTVDRVVHFGGIGDQGAGAEIQRLDERFQALDSYVLKACIT